MRSIFIGMTSNYVYYNRICIIHIFLLDKYLRNPLLIGFYIIYIYVIDRYRLAQHHRQISSVCSEKWTRVRTDDQIQAKKQP